MAEPNSPQPHPSAHFDVWNQRWLVRCPIHRTRELWEISCAKERVELQERRSQGEWAPDPVWTRPEGAVVSVYHRVDPYYSTATCVECAARWPCEGSKIEEALWAATKETPRVQPFADFPESHEDILKIKDKLPTIDNEEHFDVMVRSQFHPSYSSMYQTLLRTFSRTGGYNG